MRISDWSSDVCSSDLTTQPIAAPDKVRQEPLAGPVGECVQWCRFTRRHVPAQVIVELRLVVDRGFSARLLLLPLGGQGCACGPRCYGQQHGQQRDATSGPSHREPSLQHMVRRVAGPDASTGKSCCRSGFSRELLPWSPRLAAEAAPTRAEAQTRGPGRGYQSFHVVEPVSEGCG